jgi:hypothetical protein
VTAANDGPICVNGIDAISGDYLLSPLSAEEIAKRALGESVDRASIQALRRRRRSLEATHLGLPAGVDACDPRQAGWGLVLDTRESIAVRAALDQLVAHRREQVGEARCIVLDYRPGELRRDWLIRHGVAPGSVQPTKVPYYLLLVGEPELIPFSFQTALSVEYAVGRICFETAEEYRRYVESVIEYEHAPTVERDRRVAFFATRHSFDRATQLSADSLAGPLAADESGIVASRGFATEQLIGAGADKSALLRLITGTAHERRPALCFTATHGMGWPLGHQHQLERQGALLCQDWQGRGSMRTEDYLAASDIPDDARLHGLFLFCFACYGGGTPQFDSFTADGRPNTIAERPFVARLAQRLLGHRNGGAIALIAHVDRAWGYSITTRGTAQLQPFQNAIARLLEGHCIGFAAQDFVDRYRSLAVDLSDLMEERRSFNLPLDPAKVAALWTERADARNFTVIGDPAARMVTTP